MAKSDVIQEAVDMGLGESDELEKMTVKEIRAMMDIEPKCDHEYVTVKVIADPNNYTVMRCHKCGHEKGND